MAQLSRYAKRQLFMRSKKILATAREQYATRDELAKIYGVAEITVRMWIHKYEGFPKPLRTGITGRGYLTFYKKSEVQAWLDARAVGRSSARRVVSAVK